MGKKDKKKVTAKKLLTELEIANNHLVNEQLYHDLKYYKQQDRLQKKIHDKTGWRAYCV